MSHVLAFEGVRAPVHGDVMGGPWSFRVPAGAFLAAQAPPSAADTVLALCVGELAPMEGSVEVLGASPSLLPRFQRLGLLRRMGVAFQREGLVSNLPLVENLVVPLVFASGYTRADALEAAGEAMEALGLSAFAHRRPAGMTREARILGAVARAAVRAPELLLLEHLTAGLPDALAERALRWCRERCGTILVLVPGPSPVLDRLADGWLSPLRGPREEGITA